MPLLLLQLQLLLLLLQLLQLLQLGGQTLLRAAAALPPRRQKETVSSDTIRR